MIYKIITTELQERAKDIDFGEHFIAINPREYKKNIKILSEFKEKDICIYDITKTVKLKNKESIDVADHINRTGHNPLIGNQHLISNQFVDISNIYKNKKGIITDCIGQYFDKNYKNFEYPSHYLCYISTTCKAVGIQKMKAKLVNILK